MSEATIRNAMPGDEKAILDLIIELAVYERAPNGVINTANILHKDLFVDKVCEALVVEKNINETAIVVGFALYYMSYSTWKGRCMYLEDFYLQPEHRRGGIGEMLFLKVVDIARDRGYKRMDWQVLEWNEPALNFYKKHNAILDGEWINGRLFFD
jgi:GNAT superfamily N-acetyltransferase